MPGDHIGDSIFVDGLYEGALLQSAFSTLLHSYAGRFAESACLDVGANIGNHSVFFADRFARVVAVEQTRPDRFCELRYTADDSRMAWRPVAAEPPALAG